MKIYGCETYPTRPELCIKREENPDACQSCDKAVMRLKLAYVCGGCGAKHYQGLFRVCCDFDDMGGNDR